MRKGNRRRGASPPTPSLASGTTDNRRRRPRLGAVRPEACRRPRALAACRLPRPNPESSYRVVRREKPKIIHCNYTTLRKTHFPGLKLASAQGGVDCGKAPNRLALRGHAGRCSQGYAHCIPNISRMRLRCIALSANHLPRSDKPGNLRLRRGAPTATFITEALTAFSPRDRAPLASRRLASSPKGNHNRPFWVYNHAENVTCRWR